MCSIFSILNILMLVFFATNGAVVMRPSSSLSVMVDEGFVVYLEVPKSFGAIEKCWFKFQDDEQKTAIDFNATEAIVTDRGESVLPFADGVCGIRVSKVTTHSAGRWSLEVQSVYEVVEEGSVDIDTLPRQKVDFETHVLHDIGGQTIACSKHPSFTKYCNIFDGHEGHAGCDWYRDVHENSTYDCHMYNWGRMQASQEHIVVGLKNATVYTFATVEETRKSTIMRCQFADVVQSSCQAEMPDGVSELFVMEGLYNGRYSAYDTLRSQSRCSLEVPKPYANQDEGVWRIINRAASTPTGCIFYIGGDKKAIIDRALVGLESKVLEVKQYDTDNEIPELGCQVPFVIDDCYLSDPNGTVYFPNSIQFKRHRMYGRCVFTKKPVIPGLWSCGARSHDYDREVVQQIEVLVKPPAGDVLVAEVHARRGDSAVEFMCRSSYAEPLSHCAFVGPQRQVHLVGTANSLKTAGRVQYFGSGLQHGECGIKISDIRARDFGKWRCQMVFVTSNKISKFEMTLTENGLAHATSIGLGVGLTVIALLVMGVVIGTVFYRRRNASARSSFTLNQSMELNETEESPNAPPSPIQAMSVSRC